MAIIGAGLLRRRAGIAAAGGLAFGVITLFALWALHRDGSAEILAVVDGHAITTQTFELERARRVRESAGRFTTAEQQRALLEEMVRIEVFAANAARLGYDKDPDVRLSLKQVLAGKFQQEQIEPQLRAVSVGDDEVSRYYREHLDDFTVPESARAAVIFFALSPTASASEQAAVRDRADAALSEAHTRSEDRGFGALAVRYSEDQATRYLGGDTGWLAKGQKDTRWDPAVMDAIFSLTDPGEVAPIVSTSSGVYLLKLLERKPAVVRPLAEVSGGIRQRLASEKRGQLSRALVDTARRQVHTEVYPERLQSLPPAAVPAAGAKHPLELPRQ